MFESIIMLLIYIALIVGVTIARAAIVVEDARPRRCL
jgi:hypothetical protein